MEDKDYYDDLFERSFCRLVGLLTGIGVGIILCLLLSTCLSSCTTKEYVTVPEYHYDYRHTTDTVRERDSVITERETVIREADSTLLATLGIQLADGQRAILVLRKELERIRNDRQETRCDTVVKVDSVYVPQPVERKLTRWQRFKMDYGAVSLGGSAVAVALAAFLLLRWLRRRDK